MKFFFYIVICLVIQFNLLQGEQAGSYLNESNADELHSLMQPRTDETEWRKIAWHPNVWSARQEAARLGKPIYLWEMDGHPLGCT